MNVSTRVNPLLQSALTLETIRVGMPIIVRTPPPNSRDEQTVTILSDPYHNDEGDLVVDVRHDDGHETTELTSELGLTGDRFSGEWYKVAIGAIGLVIEA